MKATMADTGMTGHLAAGARSLLLVALLVLPARLPAAVVEFDMGGVITDVTSAVHIPIPGINVGDPWRVRARYEGDPAAAAYGATSRFILQYYEVSISPGLALTIVPHEERLDRQVIDLAIGRNSTSGNFLQFMARNGYYFGNVAQGALPIWPSYLLDGRQLWNSFVVLQDPAGDAWLYNEFANSLAFGREDFPAARFVVNFYDDRRVPSQFDSVFGSVDYYRTTVVPAPATLVLLVTGVGFVAGAGRWGKGKALLPKTTSVAGARAPPRAPPPRDLELR